MAAITANTGSNNWNTNGAWVGGVQPTAADDVTIPASAVVTIPTAITALCRSCTVQASGTLAFATNSSTLTIGDGTAGAGNVAFSNAGTITLTGVGTINYVSTSATVQTITTGGQNMPNQTWNGAGGSWQFADNNNSSPSTSATWTLTAGTLDVNGKTCTCRRIVSTNSNVRSLILGAANITTSGSTGEGWDCTIATNLTLSAASATIRIGSGLNGNIFSHGATATFGTLILANNGNQNATITGGTLTFGTLTFTGAAAIKTSSLLLASDITVTGTFTATGNSLTSRVLVQSSVVGTARTITAAAISLSNVDFTDITGAGLAANAAWTGTSLGDGLGNSNITFTAPVTRFWVGGAGNWSDTAHWSTSSGGSTGASVPLAHDTVRIDGNSLSGAQSINMDVPRACKDLDMTGNTQVSGFGAGGVGQTVYGSVTLVGGYTAVNCAFTFTCRGNFTITSNGGGFGATFFYGASTGVCSLADALTVTGGNGIFMSGLTFTTNNFAVTTQNFNMTGALPNTLNAGTSTFTLTNTLAVASFQNAGTQTVNASSATFVISTASANTRTFAGNGKTFGTLTYTVANSPGSLTITGANTFSTINVGSGRILTMPSSTTNTVTSTFNVNGAVNGYVYLPGLSGSFVSTPDSVPLSITGDIDVRCQVAMDTWTPAGNACFVGKWNTSGNLSWQFFMTADGKLNFIWSADGSASLIKTSTVATGLGAGALKWVRVTLQVNNGSAQNVVKFYTADDGSTWTQLGSTVTTAGTTSIFDSTEVVSVGAQGAGTANLAAGKFYRAQIRSNILDDGSGIQYDANFTTKAFGVNSFAESSSNAATVTISGAAAQAGDGRVTLNSSTGGTTGTLSKASGTVSCDYLSLQDSTATGGAGWYAGTHSVRGTNVNGWIFDGQQANGRAFFEFL